MKIPNNLATKDNKVQIKIHFKLKYLIRKIDKQNLSKTKN